MKSKKVIGEDGIVALRLAAQRFLYSAIAPIEMTQAGVKRPPVYEDKFFEKEKTTLFPPQFAVRLLQER